MLRKLIFVLCAVAVTLTSCGRQVTPNRTGTSANGLPSGFIELKFNTYQPMDFTNVWYVFVLNTSGTGGEPYALNGNQQQNWLNYSFEVVVYQLPGQSAPQASIIQFLIEPGTNGGTIKTPSRPFVVSPQQLVLYPNCNGSQTQLCVQIDRRIFAGLLFTPTPSPSPSASPTSSPSTSPSPGPSVSPTTQPFGGSWFINWFTVNPTSAQGNPGQVIDAPGQSGPNDLTWLPPNPPGGVYDTTTTFDFQWQGVPPPGWVQVTPSAAQIQGGEVINTP